MFDTARHDGVLVATMRHPPVNAIDARWLERFGALLDELATRDNVGVLLVRSSLKTFCAGADLKLMRASIESPDGADAMVATVRAMQRLFDRIEALPQVTIAEIGGAALGGGFELALACDLRIAAANARVGLPEASLGLLPGAGGTQRLSRLAGPGVARRLILGAEVVDGAQARALGLVQWAVPADELEARAAALARRIAGLSPAALAACKRCLAAHDGSLAAGLQTELDETAALYGNADTRARVEKFLNK